MQLDESATRFGDCHKDAGPQVMPMHACMECCIQPLLRSVLCCHLAAGSDETAGTLAVQAKVCQGLQFMFMCHITLLWQATLSAAVSHISSSQEQYRHGMCGL